MLNEVKIALRRQNNINNRCHNNWMKMKWISLMLATVIVLASVGIVEAQRKPMEGMGEQRPKGDMEGMEMPGPMRAPEDYRFFGLEDFFLIGPLFELIGHLLFFIFSRSAMLCMRLARVFVK